MTGSSAELAPVAAIPAAGVAAGDGTLPPKSKPKGGIVATVVLAVVAAFWISPLVLLVITAVRPLSDFVANGPLTCPRPSPGRTSPTPGL
jgi:raffinose/stachyose/melibiose transport system permease protein